MTHQMILQSTDHAGIEKWYCSTCGRTILLSWPPHYSLTVIVAGDEMATHSGSKGGLRIGVEVEPELNEGLRREIEDVLAGLEWD